MPAASRRPSPAWNSVFPPGEDGRSVSSRAPGPADGGFLTELDVRPGGALAIHFQTTDGSLGPALHGDVRPRVRITARSDEIDWQGTRTIELLRKSGGVSAALRWQPRAID
jgi:hypothetical protein